MGLENWLFGGDATAGINAKPQHGDFASGFIQNQLGTVGQRQAPMAQAAGLGPAAQLANGPQADARGQMQGVASRLAGIASGQQAGAGELAVNRQVGQAQAAQTAMARMARGANAALAARNAARNTADVGLAGAGQAQMAQMQDQQGANAQLAGLLGNMRGQDIGLAGQNAQLQQQRMLQQGMFGQQTNLANQQARLAQTGMNDQAQLSYLANLLGWDQAELQAQLAKAQIATQDKGHLGGLLQAAGGIGAAAAGGG